MTPNEPFRLMPYNSELVLEARLGDTWGSLYRLGLEPASPADYEMGNWYASTYPWQPVLRESPRRPSESEPPYVTSLPMASWKGLSRFVARWSVPRAYIV